MLEDPRLVAIIIFNIVDYATQRRNGENLTFTFLRKNHDFILYHTDWLKKSHIDILPSVVFASYSVLSDIEMQKLKKVMDILINIKIRNQIIAYLSLQIEGICLLK